jgi:hypothetical protein
LSLAVIDSVSRVWAKPLSQTLRGWLALGPGIDEGHGLVLALGVAVELGGPVEHLEFDVDAGLGGHGLHQHGGGVERLVALVGKQANRLSAVAGLGQQLLRRAQVALVAARLRAAVVGAGRRHDRIVDGRKALGHGARDLGRVERQGECAAHAHVLQHRVGGLKQQRHHAHHRRGVDDDVAASAHLDHVGRARAQEGVDASAVERGLCGRRIGNDGEAQILDLGLLAAGESVARLGARNVAVETREFHVLAALPFLELVGAGADRFLPLAVGVDRAAVQHRGAAAIGARHHRQEEAARALELEDHGLRVGCFDRQHLGHALAVELGQAAPAAGGLQVALPAPHHVVGNQRGAVLELDAFAQREGVGQSVGGGVDTARKHGPDRGVLAQRDQALDHVQQHVVRVVVAVAARVGGADVGVDLYAQRLAGAVLRHGRGGRETQAGGRDAHRPVRA